MAPPNFGTRLFPFLLFISLVLLHYKYIYGGTGARADGHTDTVLENLILPELDLEVDLQSRYDSLFLEAVAVHAGRHTGGLAGRTRPELAAARSALSGNGGDGSSGQNSAYSTADSGRGHSRLVVLPDLHGDAQQAARALQLAGLIAPNYTSAAAASDAMGSADAAGLPETWRWEWQWTGSDALLVQLGDVVDRGADSLALLGLLERLRRAAEAAGGRVRALLGNHELMQIHHDYRYVSREELRALGAAARLPPLWPGAGNVSGEPAIGAGEDETARGGAATARGLAGSTQEPLRQEQAHDAKAEAKEERSEVESLRGEVPRGSKAAAAHAPLLARDADQDRELRLRRRLRQSEPLQAMLSESRSRRQLLFQDLKPAPQETQQPSREQLLAQMRAGLELWRGGLAPDQPLGALIRRRPLALLAEGGGCKVLVVHAGAFPWMLTAIDRALGVGKQGAQQEGKEEEGGLGGVSGGRLTPQQYVDAWNAVATEALVHCDGRWCRHGGDRAAAEEAGQDKAGDGVGGGGGSGSAAGARWRFRRELAELLLGGEGTVWSRRYIQAPSQQMCAEVAAVVERMGVQRVVVGHTVQHGGRVSARCGGQLLMADVTLSRAIAG